MGIGACAPSSLGNYVHSAASVSLTVKISKITKEKHVGLGLLHFRQYRQKHAKTHVSRLKQSLNPGKERKNSCCAPVISFPGDATERQTALFLLRL